jgi:hypothetical protein
MVNKEQKLIEGYEYSNLHKCINSNTNNRAKNLTYLSSTQVNNRENKNSMLGTSKQDLINSLMSPSNKLTIDKDSYKSLKIYH